MLRDGDKDAIALFIEENQKNIFALAYRFTGNRDDAKDITQETFLKAIQNIKKFRGDSSPATWLYAIASNLLKDRATKNESASMTTIDENTTVDCPSFAEEFEASEERAIVLKALRSLPEEMRTAFILRFDRGLKIGEIARAIGKSEGTIKAQIHEALIKIRKIAGVENEE